MSFPKRDTVPVCQSAAVWLATGLGVGQKLPAPGTSASLIWGLPLAWAISLLPGWGWAVAVIAVLNLAGVPLCTRAGRDLGGIKDSPAIVWDEIVTVPIAFCLVHEFNWQTAAVGFGLIRLLDITKPPPARQCERLPEGWGVMADDVVAGIYAAIALSIITRY